MVKTGRLCRFFLIPDHKSDLSEKKSNSLWIKALSNENVRLLEVNCLKGIGLNAIKPLLLELLKYVICTNITCFIVALKR